jgi:hypothetical protein
MHYPLRFCGIAIAIVALAAEAPGAAAQENTFTITCQNVGNGAPEPLADREGHSILVNDYSCRADSGPLSGGVWTGRAIWEFDKTNAVLVSGTGVVRKPDAIAVYQDKLGKLVLTITDGKVSGFASTGQGSYLAAVGSAASLAGKSYTWTEKSTGPGQFMVELKVE